MEATWTSSDGTARLYLGDALTVLRTMPNESVNCCVTSPPYWGLRDYGIAGQLGLESTPDEYVASMVAVFAEVRRVLADDGTLWLNIGDSYNAYNGNRGASTSFQAATEDASPQLPTGYGLRSKSLKPKDLIGIPWLLAFALRADGWWLRSEIIWAKPNGMPGSQEDRVTSSHETIFMLTKSATYWSDFDAIKTPPRESTMIRLAGDVQAQAGSHRAHGGTKTMKAVNGNDKQRGHSRRHAGFNDRWDQVEKSEQQAKPAMMRDVWFVSPAQSKDAHFAVMPAEIARRCILAGCPEGGTVLDPFNGSGTTGQVALRHWRNYVGIDINPEYVHSLAVNRIESVANAHPLFEASPLTQVRLCE